MQYDKQNQNLISEESALLALEKCKQIGYLKKKAQSSLAFFKLDKKPVLVDNSLMELCENIVQNLADVEMEEDFDEKDQCATETTISEGNKTSGNESISLNKTASTNMTVSIPISSSSENITAGADNKTVGVPVEDDI